MVGYLLVVLLCPSQHRFSRARGSRGYSGATGIAARDARQTPWRDQNSAGVTMGYRFASASKSLSPVIR